MSDFLSQLERRLERKRAEAAPSNDVPGLSVAKLLRDYRCEECGGRLTERVREGVDRSAQPDNWYVCCGRCGGVEFIHERKLQQQKAQAVEVIDGLPPSLAAKFQEEELPPLPEGIFPLGQELVEI